MQEEFSNNEFDNNSDDLISRYEEMVQEGKNYYFDVEDFEFILDFYIDMNQLGKAKNVVRYAFYLHPEALPLHVKKAKILLKNNSPKRALTVLENVQNIEMDNTELYQIKGHAYVLLNDLNSAKDQYNQAIELIHDKEELVDMLYGIAQTLQYQDQYKLATQYLLQAYNHINDYLFILYDLGYCFEKLGDNKQSLFYYKQYLEKDPYSDNVWFTLGRLNEEEGNEAEALDAYEFVHAINPKFSEVLLELARIYEDSFQYEKAVYYYKEYLELEPESFEVLYYIGNCYNLLDELDYAQEFYRKSLDIEPFNASVFHGIASVYYKMKEYSDALFYSKRAILIDNDNAKFYVLYGKVSSKMDKRKQAVKAYRKTVDIKPQLTYYWILLTDELIRQNDYERCLKYLHESLEFHDNSPSILFRLAGLYYKKENTKMALQYFKQAIALDKKLSHEFFNLCPEAKSSTAINKILTDQTIKK